MATMIFGRYYRTNADYKYFILYHVISTNLIQNTALIRYSLPAAMK